MNYNISIELDKLPGARIMDIQGKNGPRRCVVIPIDNARGMLVDAFSTFDHHVGGEVWKALRNAHLNLCALESRDVRFGSHYLKPSFSKEFFKTIAEEDRKNIPIVGNLKPMSPKNQQQAPQQKDSLSDEEDW